MSKPKITNQEIFDTVVTHARKQCCKSQEGDNCLYRGPNETKCFAGIFIPDSLYKKHLEGSNADFVYRNGCFMYDFNLSNVDLVSELQRVHDSFEVDEWENRFKSVADMFNLTYKSFNPFESFVIMIGENV